MSPLKSGKSHTFQDGLDQRERLNLGGWKYWGVFDPLSESMVRKALAVYNFYKITHTWHSMRRWCTPKCASSNEY